MLAVSCELSASLLARRIGRSANMQVTQVAQRRFILVAHAARELRIIQTLIPRGLWHILQHAQSLPNRLSPILGHLLPLG
jgi:hypothetical protein